MAHGIQDVSGGVAFVVARALFEVLGISLLGRDSSAASVDALSKATVARFETSLIRDASSSLSAVHVPLNLDHVSRFH